MSRVELVRFGKRFGSVSVIEDLDLVIEEGQFLVLLGPSGCGKTTALRCVAGLEQPSEGDIRIGDQIVASSQSLQFMPPYRRDIGMVFQSYALWPHMTVFSNVAYPLKARRKFTGRIEQRVAEVLEIVGLGGYGKRYPSELSGGQQQRVALARAIVSDPGLVLFDEPLSNLDTQLRHRLRDDLRMLHEARQRTALYVTHDQSEAVVLADRVAVMNKGVIEQLGTAQEVFQHPQTRFVAEFVGFDNIVPGRVSRGGKTPRVEIESWRSSVDVGAAAPVAEGGQVFVAVRASGATVMPLGAQPADGNRVEGRVISSIYLGDTSLVTVDVAGSHIKATYPSGMLDPSLIGNSVAVMLDPRRVAVFRA